MPFLQQHQNTENFLEALLRDHTRYAPIVEILDNIVLGLAELTWEEAEAIGLELGRQNGSEFCAGIRTGMIGALSGQGEAVQRKERLQILTEFATAINGNSGKVEPSDVEKVRAAGWSDQTIEDVIALAAVLKVYSILANGFGFKALPSEAFAQMGAMTVQSNGYLPVFKSFVAQMQQSA